MSELGSNFTEVEFKAFGEEKGQSLLAHKLFAKGTDPGKPAD